MTFAAEPFAAAVNHLLTREAWAREKLVPYANRTARLTFASVSVTLRVQPDGYLAAVDKAEPKSGASAPEKETQDAAKASGAKGEAKEIKDVDVALSLSADVLPAFVQGGKAAAMKHVKIEGDAEFAQALGYLAGHLRWEPEEDLARLIGDAQATYITSCARAVGNHVRTASRNLRDSVVDYLLDENPQLVRHSQLDEFNAELARTRDALARAEKRVERLTPKAPRTAHNFVASPATR